MRIARHKSCQSLAAAERHGRERHRIRHLKNPDRSKENLIYKKYKDLTLVQSWKKDTEGIKVRKNAVYVIEIVLTFSPEAQKEVEPQCKEWLNTNMNWVAKEFGKENILQARCDFDEATLHQHIFVVPLIDEKLNAREMIGNRTKLSKLQTSYAKAVESFGLQRGRCYIDEKDRPRHKSLKTFHYEEVKEKNFEENTRKY